MSPRSPAGARASGHGLDLLGEPGGPRALGDGLHRGECRGCRVWRDGTTHLVLSPLEFMQRLAALVPRPRLHLIRFGVRITSLREVSGPPLREHGVLAPNAKLRAMVVPQCPDEGAEATQPVACEATCAHRRPVRLSWARLLKRVFDLDLQHCPNCGGEP